MSATVLAAGILAGTAVGGGLVAALLFRLFRDRQRYAEAEIESLKQRLVNLQHEKDKILNDAAQLRASAQAYVTRCEQIPSLQEKIKELEQQVVAAQGDILRYKSESVEARTQVEELNDRLAEREKRLEQALKEVQALRESLNEKDTRLAELQTRMEEERRATEEKLALLEKAREQLSDAFKSLSSETLKQNTAALLEQTKHMFQQYQEQAKGEFQHHHKAVGELLSPMRDTLEKLQKELQESEQKRHEMQGALTQQIRGLLESQQKLQQETGNLVRALRQPQQRGRWGEMQLRRVVELAGMQNYCDFEEQVSVRGDGSGQLRPDMVVNLPGGRRIIVDAKVSLDAYLKAVESADPQEQEQYLREHASQVKQHVNRLSSKSYWESFSDTPDFVVMFIPGEPFFSEALRRDLGLIEYAAERKIMFATPTTLIALLRAVAYGWQQHDITQNALKIKELGSEFLDRFRVFTEHLKDVGESLEKSVKSYNKAVSSLESRLLVSARRFPELGVQISKQLPEVKALHELPRQLPVIPGGDTERRDE